MADCASAGSYILVVSLIAGGLLLATDYLLIRAAALCCICQFAGWAGPYCACHDSRALVAAWYKPPATSRPRSNCLPRPPLPTPKPKRKRATTKRTIRTTKSASIAIRQPRPNQKWNRRSIGTKRPTGRSGRSRRRSGACRSSPRPPPREPRRLPCASVRRARPNRDRVREELDAASRTSEAIDYELPPLGAAAR